MRRPLALARGIVGLAAAVYGAASLTGGWLGTPPWWEVHVPDFKVETKGGVLVGVRLPTVAAHEVPREGREWISAGVTAAGLGLLAWAAWPRMRSAATPTKR